jgi:NAD dependent epimerase/dehydratase
MAKKVLVTGAGGFIGSHLVEHLVEQGFEVRAMVRYNSRSSIGNLEFLPADTLAQVEIIRGDLKDGDFCRQAVQGCSYVFHLGALIAIPFSYQNPLDYVQTNVVGTANLLNAARHSDRLERFIHTSTSEVYGTALYTPIDEKHPLQPQSPYSASKIGADNLVLSYYLSFDFPATIIRPFNTFGPRQSARAVIPTIISQLLSGQDIKLGSLEPKRDFLFVKDTARGFLHVGTHDRTLGQVMNLGTGVDVSIGQTLDLCAKLIGVEPRLHIDTQRIRPKNSEVMHLLCNAQKSFELTDWRPQFTLEQGLQQAIEFVRAELRLYNPSVYAV